MAMMNSVAAELLRQRLHLIRIARELVYREYVVD
jgi:hypothetical protein